MSLQNLVAEHFAICRYKVLHRQGRIAELTYVQNRGIHTVICFFFLKFSRDLKNGSITKNQHEYVSFYKGYHHKVSKI